MKILFHSLLLILFCFSLSADKGEVVYEKNDYYIVDIGYSYTLIEWYGGCLPSEGDILVGNLKSYGFKDIYNVSKEREMRAYIEDYLLSKEDAIEMIYECN